MTRQVPTDSLLSSVQLPEGKRMQAGPPGPTPRALLPEPVGRTVWGGRRGIRWREAVQIQAELRDGRRDRDRRRDRNTQTQGQRDRETEGETDRETD